MALDVRLEVFVSTSLLLDLPVRVVAVASVVAAVVVAVVVAVLVGVEVVAVVTVAAVAVEVVVVVSALAAVGVTLARRSRSIKVGNRGFYFCGLVVGFGLNVGCRFNTSWRSITGAVGFENDAPLAGAVIDLGASSFST